MTSKTARPPEVPRYIMHYRGWKDQSGTLKRGDYVLATKYGDGDPGDHFAVGFYVCPIANDPCKRHMVVDAARKPYRANGFRRVAKIGSARGTWIVNHLSLIEQCKDIYSVWHWFRAPWRELHAVDTYLPPKGDTHAAR